MKNTPVLALFALIAAMAAFGAASAEADSALYNKGLMALRSGDAKTAISMISKALEFDPGNYRYYNDRGVAHRKAGDLEKALADYSRSLDIRPDYTNALNNRGVVFLQTGDYDKAIQDFTEALRYGGLESIVHTNLGAALARKGDHRKAVKEFEAAIAQQPTDPRAFLFLAESLEEIGEKERSLKLYQRARTASTDPSITAGIEKRIAELEKRGSAATIQPEAKLDRDPRENKLGQTTKTPQSRRIQLARPVPSPAPEPNFPSKLKADPVQSAPQKPQEPKIESLQELERKSRVKALEKFSPASREIYLQGVQFLEQSDPAKALIRFEDCSQLEKRNKNQYGVAWNSLELGRVHSRLADHLKAAGHLSEALKYFLSHGSSDETILALVALANNLKAMGQKEKASQYYARAIEESSSKGYSNLANALQDLAQGKIPKPVEQKISEKSKTDQQAAKASAAPATAVPPVNGQRKAAAEQVKPPAKNQPSTSASVVETSPKDEPGRATSTKEAAQAQQRGSGQDYGKLEMVGRGPVAWGQSPKSQTLARPQTETKNALSESVPNSQTQQTQRLTFSMKNPVRPEERVPSDEAHRKASPVTKKTAAVQPEEKSSKTAEKKIVDDRARLASIRKDLLELRRLRQAGDEANMIVVLERIAENFAHNRDYEKALHALSASLAFREKIGKKDGIDITLLQSGLMKQKMGDLSAALEDFTRSMVLAAAESKTAKTAELAAKTVASRMNINPEGIIDSLQRFWRSRVARDNQSETQALYSVAKIYDKAERNQDALNYYERASASVLTDKARVYERIGKNELAEQAYAQALEAFKKLDYSRYMNMKSDAKKPSAMFRN